MKRFLSKCMIVIIIVFAIIILFNEWYKTTPEYRQTLEAYEKSSIPYDIDVANVGTSHGRDSFKYNTSENSFNFALASQYFMYDYKLLEQYKDHFSENATIIIPVSYFSLYRDPFEDMETFKKQNVRYYLILDSLEIEEFEFSELIRVTVPIIYYDNLKELFKIKEVTTTTTSNQFKDESESAVNRHLKIIKPQEDKEVTINETEYSYLLKILDFCKENNFNAVLTTTPLTDVYLDKFDKDILELFLNDIKKISEENDVPYLDYADDKRFYDKHELFTNSNHLNKEGGEIFTEIILDDISKILN